MSPIKSSLGRHVPSASSAEEMRSRARLQAVKAWRQTTPILVVALDDDRLTWPERELVRQLGERLNAGGRR